VLRIGARRAEFIVVCASDRRSLDERRFSVLYGVFSSSGSDHWEFINPATFVAFFLNSPGGATLARDLRSTLTELKRVMPDYATLGLGQSTGTYLAHFSWRGKIKTLPKGSALADVMRLALENSSPLPVDARK
jgi:hypothetical protein